MTDIRQNDLHVIKLEKLASLRNKVEMTYFETHPYSKTAGKDKSGFIETMEWRIKNGYEITPKQREIIDRMFLKYCPGEEIDNQGEQLAPAGTYHSDITWTVDEVTISAEGGFVKINGGLIGPICDRADAKIVGRWLSTAYQDLKSRISDSAPEKEPALAGDIDDFPADEDIVPF